VSIFNVQRLRLFLAAPHIARIRVSVCRKRSVQGCGPRPTWLCVWLSDRRLEWRCPDQATPVKARARAAPACRLTLDGLAWPSFDGLRAKALRERVAAPRRMNSADKLAPFSLLILRAEGAPWLIIRNLGRVETRSLGPLPDDSTRICATSCDE